MTDESKTGGNAQPTSAVATQATPAAVAQPDSAQHDGVQARIDSVVAQKNEFQKKYEQAQGELEAEREKSKSEQQKAMDIYANERLEQFKLTQHDPLTASAEQMKVALQGQVDHFKTQVPEDKRPPTFESLPLVQQLEAYKALASGLGTATTKINPVTSSGSPATPDTTGKVWTRSEIRAVNSDPVKWREVNEEILQAQRDGRIDMSK